MRDIIVISDIFDKGLGDHFCASAALRSYYNNNFQAHKIVLFSQYPDLYAQQTYINQSFGLEHLAALDYGAKTDFEYEKIIHLYSKKDFKDKTNIVEQYCEKLGVRPEHYPNFEIRHNRYKFDKTILLALETGQKHKSVWNAKEVEQELIKRFPQFNFVTTKQFERLPADHLPEICSKMSGYVSINSGYYHLLHNKEYIKKGIHLYVDDVYKYKFGYKDSVHYKFDKIINVDNLCEVFYNTLCQ